MTQAELSEAMKKYDVHLDRAAVAKIERGMRLVKDYELVALAKALETSVPFLLTGRRR